MASYPLPSRSISWPGKTESCVSASGHPRKIEGIKSTKIWVIAIDAIKAARKSGFILAKAVADKPRSIVPTKFI